MCQYERLVVCGTTLEEATQRGPGLVSDIHNSYFHFQNQILIKICARTCVLSFDLKEVTYVKTLKPFRSAVSLAISISHCVYDFDN